MSYVMAQSKGIRVMHNLGYPRSEQFIELRIRHGFLDNTRDDDSLPICVLIIDYRAESRRALADYLEEQGMRVLSAGGRIEMLRHFAACEPDLVVLDLGLDADGGLGLLREVRFHCSVPVIIVAGQCSDENHCVAGLEFGADDYIAKPFGLRELLARIRAVLRRRRSCLAPSPSDQASGGFSFEGWRLDLSTRRLVNPVGAAVSLTRCEYRLLTAFLHAPARPLSREYLQQVTRAREDIFDRSIDVQVLRLRRKLEVDPSAPRAIQTERGVGYRFGAPVERWL
jgi:two-component system, OmpR family, response regulator